MIGDTVGRAQEALGSGLAAGAEGSAAYLMSLVLSPLGLALVGGALLVAFWKGRG